MRITRGISRPLWITSAEFGDIRHAERMNPAQPDAAHPFLVSRREPEGIHTGNQYGRDLRRGRLLKLRRGVYIPVGIWAESHPSERFSLTAAATALQLDEPIFCRETALHLHGLPLLQMPPDVQIRAAARHQARKLKQPSMTGALSAREFSALSGRDQPGPSSALGPNSLRGFGTHMVSPTTAPDPSAPISTAAHGVSLLAEPLTGAIPDAVGRMRFPAGVVVLDAALRGGDSRPALARQQLQEGAAALQWTRRRRHLWESALAFADPASESPGESLARAQFAALGFAPPRLQVTITADGRRYRVDFLWEEAGIIGEFDGWMKYRQEGHGALREEKVREDDLRRMGYGFMRCYWEDLQDLRQLERKLLRAGVPRMGS